MVMDKRRTHAAVAVTAGRTPLSASEKEALRPDLEARGIAPSMLDILPPRGRHFQLLRASDSDGKLLGVTSLMSVRPFVSLKQNLGEGNHVGWDTSMYFAEGVDRPVVTAALLQAMAKRSFYYAMYFGQIDDDVKAGLSLVRHRLLETDYELGSIDVTGYPQHQDYLSGHKRLRRHLRTHTKAGGLVHVHEGPVDEETAHRFSELVHATYRHHGGVGRWQFKQYAYDVCGNYFRTCGDAVHISTTREGQITGLQSFIRHRDRLELAEGGFFRTGPNHHAYEAIISESVGYAIRERLDRVAYGGIWNAGKDRYCDKEGREKVYLLMLFASRWRYRMASDRLSRWAFKTYFGGRFDGASGESRVVSRLEDLPS